MVLAGEHEAVALFFCDNGECAVSADIVEGVDLPLSVLDDDELKASDLIAEPVPWLGEPEAVCCEKPLLGEDCSTLELVHLLRSVPWGREGSDRLVVVRRLVGTLTLGQAKVVLEVCCHVCDQTMCEGVMVQRLSSFGMN